MVAVMVPESDVYRTPCLVTHTKFGLGASPPVFVDGVFVMGWSLLRRLRHGPSEKVYLVYLLFVLESLVLFDQDRHVVPQVYRTPTMGRGIRFVVRILWRL